MSGSCRLLSRLLICGLWRRGVGWGAGRSQSCVSLGGGAWNATPRSLPSLERKIRSRILRCAGKAGNPFQTTQGNRLSCRDQEGRRGSEEAVPGPSVC